MKDPYLNRNRLEDVIFLIQYLGLGKNYSLAKGKKADNVDPRSAADSWELLAKDHPEFFRVMESGAVTLSLRYYCGEGEGNRAPIAVALVQQLVETAISLSERQAKRSEVLKVWGTFIAALVAAVLSIVQLFLSHRQG